MLENTLPKLWNKSQVELVSILKSGKNPPKGSLNAGGGEFYVKVSDMNLPSNGKYIKHTISTIDSEHAALVPKGSIIFPKRGGAIGTNKKRILTKDSHLDLNIMALIPKDGMSGDYLYYWMLSIDLGKLDSGSSVPQINNKDIGPLEIPVPPLNEQTRIANKLDELLAQVDTIKARVDAIPAILKRFRQSVLAAAVSGKLTEEWRKRNSEKIDNWKALSLSDVCSSISDGDHQAPPKVENGIPFLVISNVSKGYLNFNSVDRWVPKDYFNSLSSIRIPRKNDILYTVTGSFGIPVIVDSEKPFCFQRHIAIIKPKHDKVEFLYLFRFLQSSLIYQQAVSVATGTAQKTVPLKGLRNFKVLIPSYLEQKAIVDVVEHYFAFADQIEQRVKDAQSRINNLTQSILAKAFRGELVPQDPNDEPASELLERIKKEREQAAALTKATKKVTKKKAKAN